MSITIVAGHVIDRPARPLTEERATDLAARITVRHGVGVRPCIDILGVVNLWPDRAVDPRVEVDILREFKQATDSRVDWHAAGGDVVWG